MTDAELVRQCLAGTSAAYGHLVRRWAPRVTAVCHARVGRAAAEDLAQETLLRGLRGLASLAAPEKFGPWLCGIASRTCLDWLKSAGRTEVSFSALSDAGGTAPGDGFASDEPDPAERADDLNQLLHEVERLAPEYREVLMLYYYEDCTYQQVAETLGVSAATVNARLTKARMMLRGRMGAPRPKAPAGKPGPRGA